MNRERLNERERREWLLGLHSTLTISLIANESLSERNGEPWDGIFKNWKGSFKCNGDRCARKLLSCRESERVRERVRDRERERERESFKNKFSSNIKKTARGCKARHEPWRHFIGRGGVRAECSREGLFRARAVVDLKGFARCQRRCHRRRRRRRRSVPFIVGVKRANLLSMRCRLLINALIVEAKIEVFVRVTGCNLFHISYILISGWLDISTSSSVVVEHCRIKCYFEFISWLLLRCYEYFESQVLKVYNTNSVPPLVVYRVN